MAKTGKKDAKSAKADEPKQGAGIMGVIRLVTFALSLAAALFLCVSLLDMGFADLRPTLHGFAGPAAGALIVLVILSSFAGSRVAAAQRKALQGELEALRGSLDEQVTASLEAKVGKLGSVEAEVTQKLKTMEADLTQQLAAVDEKIEKFLGDQFERLNAENEDFRKVIDQSRRDELSKTSEELEALRARNQELQDKINKWAVESVDDKIGADKVTSEDKLHAA